MSAFCLGAVGILAAVSVAWWDKQIASVCASIESNHIAPTYVLYSEFSPRLGAYFLFSLRFEHKCLNPVSFIARRDAERNFLNSRIQLLFCTWSSAMWLWFFLEGCQGIFFSQLEFYPAKIRKRSSKKEEDREEKKKKWEIQPDPGFIRVFTAVWIAVSYASFCCTRYYLPGCWRYFGGVS